MSSEEEIDYMSDAFICTSTEADIRPGLNPKLKKEKPKVKLVSIKHLEKEKRDDGLQTPLTADNKGFALLAKMGFKPGSGLGKLGEGRAEPVPINIKSNREGLGRKLIIQEVAALKAKLRKDSKMKGPSVDDYRKRIVEEANVRSCKIDLSRSQKACYALDSKEGITEPEEQWFWHDFHKESTEKNLQIEEEIEDDNDDKEPSHKDDNHDGDVEDIELSVQDKLRLLTLYLRRTYFYCIWCGTQFDDDKDLQQECPGPTREDH